MAAVRGWASFLNIASRGLRAYGGTFKNRLLISSSRQRFGGPTLSKRWLLVPTAGLVGLRSLTLFKSKQSMESQETEKSAPEADVQEIAKRADDMFDKHEFDNLLVFMRQQVNAHPQNDEVLWRLARALTEKSKMTDDKAAKKQMLQEAYEIVKRALEINDKNFACHKWYAILMDKTAEFEGTKARISQAYVVKEHFMKASELNPKDATTYYTLGLWCFLFADMPWYQRKIAGALFASPPTSTYEEALQYFHKAEETEPNFFSKNLLMLGKVYSRMKDQKLALLYLTRAREFPINTTDDKEAHKEAGELLGKMGVKLDKK